MYAFDELHPDRDFINGKSVAYWLGVLKKDLPTEFHSPKALADAMSFHFDIEEQAWDAEHIRSAPSLLFDVLRPIAPVSLAEAWSPFPYAISTLGSPQEAGIDTRSGWLRPAFAIFPRPAQLVCPPPTNVHEKRLMRLLGLVVDSAGSVDRVLLVAQPGWSYDDCPRMPAHVKALMHEVGYQCVERRDWPWWRIW
jgi:hypothetical protein